MRREWREGREGEGKGAGRAPPFMDPRYAPVGTSMLFCPRDFYPTSHYKDR